MIRQIILHKKSGVKVAPFVDHIDNLVRDVGAKDYGFLARKYFFEVSGGLYLQQSFARDFSSIFAFCKENGLGIEVVKVKNLEEFRFLYLVKIF